MLGFKKEIGMFKGVFIPTFLSIIGVILYLRLGKVVGELGVLGSIFVILLAVSVTFSTALSLSSITSNIRIGSGGAYSIISKTLGLEVGGSIGIPLFLAQALSVLLYIFGFAETWLSIFPTHPRLAVLGILLAILFLLTYINIKYAIRVQVIVFFLVCLSLITIFTGGFWWNVGNISLDINLNFNNFWNVFALFFPAVTGLMAGIGMSGELSNPKKQIPRGVLWGLGISTAIYLVMVFWLQLSASQSQLLENSMIMADLSISHPIVILGILAATFSSALTTLTAAPRVLQAMGNNSILPFSNFFAQTSKRGEPKNATFFTTGILAITLPFSNLNSIAPLLTMFFLVTYSMINITVFLEQTLGFVSFRPKFKMPKFVAFYGALGSLIFMFYVDVLAGFVALGFLLAIYTFLARKKLPEQPGFVRSGLLRAVSEWAIQKVISLDESQKHIWRPHLLFPVKHDEQKLEQNFSIVKSITYPQGSLTVLGIHLNEEEKQNREEVQLKTTKSLVNRLQKDGIFTSYTEIHAKDYINGIGIALEAMKGQFLHPNILFLPRIPTKQKDIEKIINFSNEGDSGLVFFDEDENVGVGSKQNLNIWMPKEISEDIYKERNYDLSLLIAYRLQRNWSGKITLWVHKKKQKQTLENLVYQARLPESTDIKIIEKNIENSYIKVSQEDINIFPFQSFEEIDEIIKITKKEKKTNFFIKDSGEEDILA